MKDIEPKIVIVMENLEYGGATTHLINLIKSRKFNKARFLVVTNKTNKAVNQIYESLGRKKIKFHFYNSFNLVHSKSIFFKIIFVAIKPLLFLASIIQMIRIFKQISSDVIVANCGGYGDFRDEMATIIACKFLKKKNIHLLIHHCYMKPIFWKKLIDYINLMIGKFTKSLIFVSNATKKSVKENTNLFKFSKKKLVIHNGIFLRNFKKKKIKVISSKRGIIKIGMLSRIEHYKGQLDLVNAVNIISKKIQKKLKIFVIGNGNTNDIKILKKLITDLKLKNMFKIVSYINKDSLVILKNLDLFLSLTKNFEGFGYSIAEALYAGTPVIATNVGGVGEFLNKQNATLIRPSNLNDISKSIEDFYYKKSYYKKKIKIGKSLIINKFNSEKMANKFHIALLKNHEK
jgi:glycosyltransferase involved in cell wall biosynthesis